MQKNADLLDKVHRFIMKWIFFRTVLHNSIHLIFMIKIKQLNTHILLFQAHNLYEKKMLITLV
jgi:hypothetical protein